MKNNDSVGNFKLKSSNLIRDNQVSNNVKNKWSKKLNNVKLLK